MLTSNIEDAAWRFFRSKGFIIDCRIGWDEGPKHCGMQGRPESKDGTYSAHSDNPVSIWWQKHSTGESGVWTPEGEFIGMGLRSLAKRAGESRASQAHAYAEAVVQAWKRGGTITGRKNRRALLEKWQSSMGRDVPELRSLRDGELIVPHYIENGDVFTLQFVSAKSADLFLATGRQGGHAAFIGSDDAIKPLYICEGLRAGIFLRGLLNLPVLAVDGAYHFQPLAGFVRRKYPWRELILVFDDNWETSGSLTEEARHDGK